MVAIKGLKMPIECKKCRLMGTDGNPKDLFSPMMCIAIWAVTHETKHCVGGKMRDDCPLVEIEERKVGKWIEVWESQRDEFSGEYDEWREHKCSICDFQEMDAARFNFCPNCGAEMEGEE